MGTGVDVPEALTRTLTRRLARDFGRPIFQPALPASRGAEAVTASFPSGPRIQIRLLPADHYSPWPFERRELVQRYGDAGPVTLPVLTLDAFVAWKTATYMDRRAPRDLWDLAALAQLGPFAVNVAELFTALGPFRSLPSASTVPATPEESLWQRDLAHQTRLTITAANARETVIDAWANVGHRQGATG